MIISHLYLDSHGNWQYQSNEEHSLGVAVLCKRFASEFGMGNFGEIMGLLHDKGKEQKSFQQHIVKASGLDQSMHVDGDFNHAYVGALLAKKYMPDNKFMLIANCLMGHHRGLYDDGELKEVLKKPIPVDVTDTDINRISLALPDLSLKPKDINHLQRLLYSCLVDADYLDTEEFMQPELAKLRGNTTILKKLLSMLEAKLASLKKMAADTEVNRIRNYVQEQCRSTSDLAPGFYSLTVPTGGGKTLSSVLWALRHAIKNGQKRIIIAIPYTSIIVQTARTLKDIFGEENVLEHHSNVNYTDNETESNQQRRMKLATENWDYPIIVTTNVQLFESMFSNKPSSCRKLHNIVNSVLILDEVQTLSIDYLQPIVDSLDTFKRIFGCSVLFTTASQPILEGRHRGIHENIIFEGLSKIHEIIPTEARLHEKLRRVRLSIDEISSTYDEIAKRIAQFNRVLCIVNTRQDAKEIYERLPKEGICIHLSKMMCPAHINKSIQMLKKALANPSNAVIRIVSTQLIEAGVDIDFPVVFRQETGLDSILQAAGRCNREGKLDISTTYVFSLAGEHPLPKGFLTQVNNARLALSRNLDWFSPSAMTQYFEQLFYRCESFDKADIKELLYKAQLQFETAAHEFKPIEDNTKSVIINWGESMDLVHLLTQNGISYPLMKKLAQYSVNLRPYDYKKLEEAGCVEEIFNGIYCVKSPSFYSDKIGLVTDNEWLEEILIK